MPVRAVAPGSARCLRKQPRSTALTRVFLATVGCMAAQNSLVFTARAPNTTSTKGIVKGIAPRGVHRVTRHVAVGQAGYPHSVLTTVSQEQSEFWFASIAKSVIALFVAAWGAIEVLGTFRGWHEEQNEFWFASIAKGVIALFVAAWAAQTAAVGAGRDSSFTAAASGATGTNKVSTAGVAVKSEAADIEAMRSDLERLIAD